MKPFRASKRIWIVLAFAVVIAAAVAASRLSKKHSSGNTRLTTVTRQTLIQRVTVAGTVIPNRKTLITPPYNAYIRKLFVKVGDKVRANDPIVALAQTPTGGDVSYPLRAPFPGIIVQVPRAEGEYVEQGSGGTPGSNMIARIDDLSRILVDASAPEIDMPKLQIGQEVMIKASALLSHPYKGKIISIALAAREQRDWDKTRVEFPVSIAVLNPDAEIKPGMSVVIDIITGKIENVLTLPHEYINKDGDAYFVTTKDGERKKIQTGLQNEEVFEIKSGLSEGESVRQTDFLSLMKE